MGRCQALTRCGFGKRDAHQTCPAMESEHTFEWTPPRNISQRQLPLQLYSSRTVTKILIKEHNFQCQKQMRMFSLLWALIHINRTAKRPPSCDRLPNNITCKKAALNAFKTPLMLTSNKKSTIPFDLLAAVYPSRLKCYFQARRPKQNPISDTIITLPSYYAPYFPPGPPPTPWPSPWFSLGTSKSPVRRRRRWM